MFGLELWKSFTRLKTSLPRVRLIFQNRSSNQTEIVIPPIDLQTQFCKLNTQRKKEVGGLG